MKKDIIEDMLPRIKDYIFTCESIKCYLSLSFIDLEVEEKNKPIPTYSEAEESYRGGSNCYNMYLSYEVMNDKIIFRYHNGGRTPNGYAINSWYRNINNLISLDNPFSENDSIDIQKWIRSNFISLRHNIPIHVA